MNRTQTLQNALAAVTARPVGYDLPEANFDRIARRWKVHFLNRYGIDVTVDAADVAMMCADLKLARLEFNTGHEDSWTDLAGYAACGAEVSTAKVIDAVVAVESEWIDGPWPEDLKPGDWVRLTGYDNNSVPDGDYEIAVEKDLIYSDFSWHDIARRRQAAYKRVTTTKG